ncbi:MAG TPA: hypothetical protein VFH50_10580 [Acidimicrobiales bacterium]|nr:hypothetical protein [Acidimicrobiales bacterium]
MRKRLLDLLVLNGFRRGRRGSTPWLVVGAAAWMVRRVAGGGRDPKPVWTEDLEPGQTVTITHMEHGPRD